MGSKIIIIQSRMGSKRLPGKSMAMVGQLPILGHILNSLKKYFNSQDIFVVTSNNSEDDVISNYCLSNEIYCFRGDEHNVASRFAEVLTSIKPNADYFFRICGDSPFFLPGLVKEAFNRAHIDPSVEIITSMIDRGNPQGQNIELFSKKTFLEGYENFCLASHYEHVTSFFYENIRNFKLETVSCLFPEGVCYSDVKFSVDTQQDLNDIRKLNGKLGKPFDLYTLSELIRLKIEI